MKNASLTMPPGTRGVVIEAEKFSRRVNLTDAERQKALSVIRQAEKEFLRALGEYTAKMLDEVKAALGEDVRDDLTDKAIEIDTTATFDELRRVRLLSVAAAENNSSASKREAALKIASLPTPQLV